MARIARVIAIIKSLALLSWRDIRSFGSISGQNLFLFVAVIALQPESAEFFGLLLAAVLLFPLLTDPAQKIPQDRRLTWPLARRDWAILRVASLLLSPIAWVALFILARAGWRMAIQVLALGAVLTLVKFAAELSFRKIRWTLKIPAPPGAIGSLMLIQWREMLRTLDPCVAIALAAATTAYRIFGKPLDPSALRVISLVVALAISTETQVLFGLDGTGAQRYRQLPLPGWRILLAKDLAFLLLLALLVLPLDFVSGIFGGLAALAIGHHRSVFHPSPQKRWRFTSGALFMDGVLQAIALFAAGTTVETAGLPFMAFCIAAWIVSLFIYGWQWDRLAMRSLPN
jgi:hypothetical protein